MTKYIYSQHFDLAHTNQLTMLNMLKIYGDKKFSLNNRFLILWVNCLAPVRMCFKEEINTEISQSRSLEFL